MYYTNGILGTALDFIGLGDKYTNEFYIDLDDIEYYELTAKNKKLDKNEDFFESSHIFTFSKRIEYTETSPDSLFIGLAEIGGLYGLSWVFNYITHYQERSFEKELEKGGKDGSIKGLKSTLFKRKGKKRIEEIESLNEGINESVDEEFIKDEEANAN